MFLYLRNRADDNRKSYLGRHTLIRTRLWVEHRSLLQIVEEWAKAWVGLVIGRQLCLCGRSPGRPRTRLLVGRWGVPLTCFLKICLDIVEPDMGIIGSYGISVVRRLTKPEAFKKGINVNPDNIGIIYLIHHVLVDILVYQVDEIVHPLSVSRPHLQLVSDDRDAVEIYTVACVAGTRLRVEEFRVSCDKQTAAGIEDSILDEGDFGSVSSPYVVVVNGSLCSIHRLCASSLEIGTSNANRIDASTL
jgi:hypothetical protein